MTTAIAERFTQTDPLEADVGQPYPSAYVYGNNNPVVFTDPAGLRAGRAPGNPIVSRRTENGITTMRFADGRTASVAGASKTAGCKISNDWKSRSKSDCQKKIEKFVAKEAKGAAKNFDQLKTINNALGYYDMFESARGCYSSSGASGASNCTSLLTSLAGKVSGGSLISLSPTVGFLIGFNVDVAGSTVKGAFANLNAALTDPNLRSIALAEGDGAQLLVSTAGSLRFAQGTRTKLLVDCGDGF
jgi:hypothetical protein